MRLLAGQNPGLNMKFIYVSNTFGMHSQKVILRNSLIILCKFHGVKFSICSGMSFSTSDFQIRDFHPYPCLLLKNRIHSMEATYSVTCENQLNQLVFSPNLRQVIEPLCTGSCKTAWISANWILGSKWVDGANASVLTLPDVFFCSVQAMLVLFLS